MSFSLLLTKIALTKTVSGISLKTLQAYLLVYMARLCSILVRGWVGRWVWQHTLGL